MRSSKFQFAVILILILALVLQMEDVVPDIFAGSEKTILFIDEVDGMEFKAEIDSKGFNYKNELVIRTIVTNKSNLPKNYYASTNSYGMRGVIGAALVSVDKKSCFTDKFVAVAAKNSTSAKTLKGFLESGRGLVCDFYMLPFYKENGSQKHVAPGRYILSLWYNKGTEEVIKAEFPVIVKKRLNKMYIKL